MVALTFRQRVRSARGAELLELAIALPLLLIIIAGIVDFALMFQAFEVVTNAAREGARVRVLPGYTNVDAQTRVTSYLAASSLTGATTTSVTNTVIGAGGGGAPAAAGIQVQVQYVHTFRMLGPILSLIGGTFANNITLTATSVMRSEI